MASFWWSTRHAPRGPTAAPTTCNPALPPPSHTLNKSASPTVSSPIRIKYADCKSDSCVTVTTTAVPASPSTSSDSDGETTTITANKTNNTMSKGRDDRRSSITIKAVDTPRQIKTSTSASSPVQIPRQTSRTDTNRGKHHASQRRRTIKGVHSPDAVPPSVAALLVMTDIPRHRQPRQQKRRAGKSLALQDIVQEQHVSEKELSLTLTSSPLDVLLSPPDDDLATEDDMSTCCESFDGSSLRHTISLDSVPSLGDSYVTDAVSSFESSSYFSPLARPRRTRSPARKSLEPVRSPPDILNDEHPLSIKLDDDEYPVVLEHIEEPAISVFTEPLKPLKAAFKSNLTASLRALRSAAKSFSSINFPSLPPDDLLSRSILTIDPNVPYTDERRPPLTGEMPSAQLRRYLNPTTRPLEAQPQDHPQRPRLASIQMQTYKVHRSRVSPSLHSRNLPSALPPAATSSTGARPAQNADQRQPMLPAGVRQREMRENPDFIRIAVMEMAMRKNGKLDDRKPGRARWALPPRKAPIKTDTDEIGPNGVPTRWIPITYEH